MWLALVVLLAPPVWADEAAAATGLRFYPPGGFGPNAVGHQTYSIADSDRGDRSLKLDIWYPVDQADVGDEPVASYDLIAGFELPAHIARDNVPVSLRKFRKMVVFSHAQGGLSVQSTLLTETLASHGYIVVAPNHTGDTAFEETDPIQVAAINRVFDLEFVIDHMVARSADPADGFFQRIDPDEVGVTGHSLGGFAAIALAAGLPGIPADPRVKAIAPIAAPIEGIFSPSQLAAIDIPVLLMGGTEDQVVPIANNDFAFVNLAGEKPVHQIDLVGANHYQFAVVCEMGQALEDAGLHFSEWGQNPIAAILIPYYLRACIDTDLDIEEVWRLQSQSVVAFFKRYFSDGDFWGSRVYGVYLYPDWLWRSEPAVESWRKSALDPYGLWY